MKLRYHTKDGKTELEIEGSPTELAHYTHELEIRRMAHHASQDTTGALEGQFIPDSPESSMKDKLLGLSSRAVEDYILSLPTSSMDHTVRDVSMHFLGQTIPSKRQQTEYLNLFSKVKRAHIAIESKRRGAWVKNRKLGQDGNTYVVYSFKKNDEQL